MNKLQITLMSLIAVMIIFSMAVTSKSITYNTHDTIETNAFPSVFRVQRWNPPDHKGVMGVKTLSIIKINNEIRGLECSAGLPVYTVEYRYIPAPPPSGLYSDSDIPINGLYITKVYYYLLTARHCVDSLVNGDLLSMYQPGLSGYKIPIKDIYLFPINVKNDTYLPIDAALILVETKIERSYYYFPPIPESNILSKKILKVQYSGTCINYSPANETIYSFTNLTVLKEIYNNTWLGNYEPNETYSFYKSGYKTGYTRTLIHVSWGLEGNYTWLEYEVNHNGRVYKLYGIPVMQRPPNPICNDKYFARPGDSGAPVYVYIKNNENNIYRLNVVGIISAGNDNVVWIVPFDLIKKEYNILTGKKLYLYRNGD